MFETRHPGWRISVVRNYALRGRLLATLLVQATPVLAQTDPPPRADSLQATADTAAPADTLDQPEILSEARVAADEETRARLQAIFDRVESMRDVTVRVEAGVVRLTGSVAEARVAARAEELADRQEGVVWVENRIQLTTSLAERLEPTWDRLRELAYGTLAMLPLLLVAALVVTAASLLGGLVGRWGGPTFLKTGNPFLRGIIARAIQAALVVAGLLVALDLLDATALVGAVVGTAGLAGLVLGFAFKDIVENYLAGLLLALRQPFAQNDHISLESHDGKVIRLTPRETILMTLDGNHVRLPNAFVFRTPLTNFSRNPRRRFQFEVGVGPSDDLALARETGMTVLREMDGVLAEPPPEALVREIGESWVTMRFMGWVDQRSAGFDRVRSEAIRSVKGRLEAVGISLPSPEYLVRLTRDGAASPHAPAPGAVPQPPASDNVDVSVDHTVDEQIDEDRRASVEEDLLEGDDPALRRGMPRAPAP
jgi:small-conductance mechanosensitive channel